MALAEAAGALLAHSQRTPTGVVRKGTRLAAEHLAALAAAGLTQVTVAIEGADDLHEDSAARQIAEAVAGAGVRLDRAETGRCNLYASAAGLVVADRAAVDALNAVDPAITLATLPPFQRVRAGEMVATVKIIPFAAPRASVAAAAANAHGAVRLAPWSHARVAAISTTLPALKPSVVDKTLSILARRLADPGAAIVVDRRVPHESAPLATALIEACGTADVAVVFGASAVVDADDVIPTAIRAAGGQVERVGMPVDPGNLLVLGAVAGRPVIGAPGCARSPKENGFDFVLDRLLADLPLTAADIAAMGVGGLLTDTPDRPRPRRGTAEPGPPRHPAALVLAAGRSTRMGTNKLLQEVAGTAMVRRVAATALASRAESVVVVTGHDAAAVHAALEGLPVMFAHNPAYADGLSTSLRAGLDVLPDETDAVLVLLADMPLVTAGDCDALFAALGRDGARIAMATSGGARGNPVAWSHRLFGELRATEGDAGGRALLSRHSDSVVEVEIGPAAALDADTPAALEEIRRRAPSLPPPG